MLDKSSAPSHLYTTAWSVVLGAARSDHQREAYLDQLITNYWKPAYYYARRRGMNHHDATDCIQEFFARMLDGDWLEDIDPARGHFRGWLLTALRRWVSRQQKPTGARRLTLVNQEVIDHYQEADPESDPEALFNQTWAKQCLDQAINLMAADAEKGNHSKQFQIFQRYLNLAAELGNNPSYRDLAAEFELTETAITNHLHRARSRFKTYLLRVIRDTVGNPDEAQVELARLRQFLGRLS